MASYSVWWPFFLILVLHCIVFWQISDAFIASKIIISTTMYGNGCQNQFEYVGNDVFRLLHTMPHRRQSVCCVEIIFRKHVLIADDAWKPNRIHRFRLRSLNSCTFTHSASYICQSGSSSIFIVVNNNELSICKTSFKYNKMSSLFAFNMCVQHSPYPRSQKIWALTDTYLLIVK